MNLFPRLAAKVYPINTCNEGIVNTGLAPTVQVINTSVTDCTLQFILSIHTFTFDTIVLNPLPLI